LVRSLLSLPTGIILFSLACGDGPTHPSFGTEWDLLVARHRIYDCHPDGSAFFGAPDPVVCGSDTTVVTLSRDTLRARLTLTGFDPAGMHPPTDTSWTARAAFSLVTCDPRLAGCTHASGDADARLSRRERTCADSPTTVEPAICAGRAGEPFTAIGALVLLDPVIGAHAYIHSWGPATGTDVTWDPTIYPSRLADTLAFALRPVD
jgi:hypothetical protein